MWQPGGAYNKAVCSHPASNPNVCFGGHRFAEHLFAGNMSEENMRTVRIFLSIAVLANWALVMWHLYLVVAMHQGTTTALALRIGIQTSALTFGGLALLWTLYQKIGSILLIVVLALGLILGSLEHFFVAGPYNVFDVTRDVGIGQWVIPFVVSCALLLIAELAGLWAAGRVLLARS